MLYFLYFLALSAIARDMRFLGRDHRVRSGSLEGACPRCLALVRPPSSRGGFPQDALVSITVHQCAIVKKEDQIELGAVPNGVF